MNFIQIPINQVVANKFSNDYEALKDSWKSMVNHIASYQEHTKEFEFAIAANNPDKAGHHLYKAAHHMAKVKIGLEHIETSLESFRNEVPTDDKLKNSDFVCFTRNREYVIEHPKET